MIDYGGKLRGHAFYLFIFLAINGKCYVQQFVPTGKLSFPVL